MRSISDSPSAAAVAPLNKVMRSDPTINYRIERNFIFMVQATRNLRARLREPLWRLGRSQYVKLSRLSHTGGQLVAPTPARAPLSHASPTRILSSASSARPCHTPLQTARLVASIRADFFAHL